QKGIASEPDILEEFFERTPWNEDTKPLVPNEIEQEVASGFFVDLKHGYIMTNHHVIADAKEIHLKLANGHLYTGSKVGYDSNTDIAILKIKESYFEKTGLSALSFADDRVMTAGELVIALGAPFGLEASVSLG